MNTGEYLRAFDLDVDGRVDGDHRPGGVQVFWLECPRPRGGRGEGQPGLAEAGPGPQGPRDRPREEVHRVWSL